MEIPIRFLPTQTVAPETFLIRQLAGEGLGPVAAMLNSLVIRGPEPVVVDTGSALTRDGWLEQAFDIVDPADVRWIYLSHDDSDHTGALFEVLEACPRATLVTNWFTIERTAGDRMLPLERIRIVNPGESFTAGDRTLTAVVPPAFDSPTTRGLYDSATGVFWAADAFAVGVTEPVDDIAEMDPGFFRDSFLHMQRMLSPWHRWLDAVKYRRHLDDLRALGATTVVGAHGPALHGPQVESAYLLLEELPHHLPADLIGQADLEMLLALLGMETQPAAA
jgi:flavorubredoxin